MRISDLVNDKQFKHLSGSIDKEINGAYACDLLSWVIAHIKENNAWLTIQTHLNILAVAKMLEIPCIIIVDGAKVEEATIKKAKSEDITLLETNLSSYEVIRRVFND